MAPWHEQLAVLDAGGPWFDPWRDQAARVAREVRAGQPLHEALNRCAGGAVRFVPAQSLPAGVPYERFISDTGLCPTRENLHDFFNGLVWIALPQAKRQLNRLQAARIEADGVGGERGAVRDAVTLFDENGAVLCAPRPLWDALRARDWPRLFGGGREHWQEARLLVFGHALLEKLARPRKNLTAHVLDVDAPGAPLGALDAWLAAQLTEARMAGKPFVPLPVLGVPGWCAQNEDVSFYDDRRVFRPAPLPRP